MGKPLVLSRPVASGQAETIGPSDRLIVREEEKKTKQNRKPGRTKRRKDKRWEMKKNRKRAQMTHGNVVWRRAT